MILEQLIFFVLAGVATLSAIGMVLMKDPVHSALLLVFTFFNLAGLYVLLGAEFIAVVQVLVYAGAIVVLFLFVMMLLQVRPGPSLYRLRFFQTGFGPVLAVGFLVEVLLVVFASGFFLNGGKSFAPFDENSTQAKQMYASVQYAVQTFVPLKDATGNTVGGSAANPGILPGVNTDAKPVTGGHAALLGKELYSTYLYPFEIASLILLIAAIGAIVIARRELEHDTGEGGKTKIGRGISLAGPLPGSPQDLEIRKEDALLEASERKLIMKK